jgi:hypothetical protein
MSETYFSQRGMVATNKWSMKKNPTTREIPRKKIRSSSNLTCPDSF